MRLNDSQKIIGEDDILLSDGTSTLSDKLSSINDDISSLKSNVKWIYNYGGVGSGSGGSGGGDTKQFTIYATLDGVQLNGQYITLDGVGNHTLSIRINNPNGATFNVNYTYYTTSAAGDRVKQSRSQIVSIENSYKMEVVINLNSNDQLVIEATDGESTQQANCNYITQAYTFNESLVNNSGEKYAISDGRYEIFASSGKSNGVNFKVDYTISVNADINYTYQLGSNTPITGKIEDKNNSLQFALPEDMFEDQNAGLYNLSFIVELIPEGQEKITVEKLVRISIIPRDLYVLLTPEEGKVYDSQQTSDYYEYRPGYVTFNYRVYQGQNQGRSYTINATLNDLQVISGLSVVERQSNTFKTLPTAGWNKLIIKATGDTTYEKTFYFYMSQSATVLDWFKDSSAWTQYYYRMTTTSNEFNAYKGNLNISQSATKSPIKISGLTPPNTTGDGATNTHIAIGLQYYEANNDEATIFNFYNEGDTPIISIKQNATTINGDAEIQYYVPQEEDIDASDVNKYHLLQIYSNYVKSINNTPYYEISLYIDGILEASTSSLSGITMMPKVIEICSTNCNINCIDIDYSQPTGANNNCDYDVYQYYLKYCQSIKMQDISSNVNMLDDLYNFAIDTNGRVTTSNSNINNIASKSDVPVLMLTYQYTGNAEDFMKSLEASYSEDGGSSQAEPDMVVAAQYSGGQQQLQQINFPDGYTAQFRLKLQGSSTKGYRVKNFTLGIENTDEASEDIYLFSPNFDKNDARSFLPEQKFTLKADVVDSSHSNNTSCGRFINTVCTPFSDSVSGLSGKFKTHVKNCLEGFPMLLFFNLVATNPTTQEQDIRYYYLGVYNFNLGRDSYYNLGYKSPAVFGDENTLQDASSSGFTFFSMSKDDNNFLPGIGVAEIQGGSKYFDFSQYDNSILFQQAQQGSRVDNTYMFGDIVHSSALTDGDLQSKIQTLVQYTALGGGYIFDWLKKVRGAQEDGYSAEKIDDDGNYTNESLNQVPDYTKQYTRTIDAQGSSIFTPSKTINVGSSTDLNKLIIPNTDTGTLAILNYQAVSEYYTICMVLGLVDSVMKNLNIKSWTCNDKSNTTWYTAFYDMDTCLGINNAGNNTNYFAYSDYWNSKETEYSKNTVTISNAEIYRDFSPASIGESGFDVPSSYLFAVAKYARHIFDSDYTKYYPQELYAKWRSNTVNTKTNEGVLRNADQFIENFYSNALGSVNNLLISYNYRSKYFSLTNNTIWNSVDFTKFKGTRIEYVRAWLNGRLHIMDAYMNINQNAITGMQYLDNGTWKPLTQDGANITDLSYSEQYNLANNEDIEVLKSIFQQGGQPGIQLSGKFDFKIKCPEYSPIQIYSPTGIILNSIGGGDNYIQISGSTTGNQRYTFGGSQQWSYLSNINFINTTDSASITSSKLQVLNGTSGAFNGIAIIDPAIEEVNLTSSSYKGTLTLEQSSAYPNLRSVNIGGSGMSLVLNNLNLLSVSTAGLKNSGGSISISNCENLTSVDFANTTVKTFSFTNIPASVNKIDASTINANSIVMACKSTGGKFTMYNNNTVETLDLSGFETIEIKSSSKLNKVIIKQGDEYSSKPKSITISGCTNTQLCIASVEASAKAGYVDLSTFNSVETLNVSNNSGITHLICPANSGVKLTCSNCSGLQTIDSVNPISVVKQSFNGCSSYSGVTSSGSWTKMEIANDTTDISGAFGGCNIKWAFFKHFINDVVPNDNNITDIHGLFSQSNYPDKQILQYSISDYIADYKAGTLVDITKKFKNVTNSSNWIGGTGIHVHYKELISTGLNTNSISLDTNHNNYTISLTEDAYSLVKDKLVSISYYACGQQIISVDGEVLDTVDVGAILCNGMPKLKSIYYFTPQNTTLDFGNGTAFSSNFPSLTTMDTCFNSAGITNYSKLLYNLPAIKNIACSFNVYDKDADPVDLFTLVNWEDRVKNGFSLKSSNHVYGCFQFKKKITYENYLKLCNIYIANKVTNIDCLFSGTTIIGGPSSQTNLLLFGDGSTIYDWITSCNLTYRHASIVKTESSTDTEYIDVTDIFKNLPSVETVNEMFGYCKIAKSLPFDFFRKRKETIDESIYIKVNDSMQVGKLYTYDYDHDANNQHPIKDYNLMFGYCEFAAEASNYQYTDGILDNRVTDANDIEVGKTYYRKTTSATGAVTYKEYTVSSCTEIADQENITTAYVNAVSGGDTVLYNPTRPNNNQNCLIIPPDFFYPIVINGTVNCTECFASDNKYHLCGAIPNNIFKHSKTVNASSVFYNQIVLPTLRYTASNGDKLYSLYPSDYTQNKNVGSYFNSLSILLGEAGKSTKDYCVVILQDTMPYDVLSLHDGYTIAFSQVRTAENITGGDYQFNLVGRVEDGSIKLGINMNYYKVLSLPPFDKECKTLVKGNFFNEDYVWSDSRVSSVLFYGYYGGTQAVCKCTILPKARGTVYKMFNTSEAIADSAKPHVLRSQITDPDNSVEYYTNSNIIVD